ncbi:MAG TPA: zinc ribbon domain-containing protein [Solirubrobacteraceae bacterium]
MSTAAFCEACGQPVTAQARFCGHCGTQVGPGTTSGLWADAGDPPAARASASTAAGEGASAAPAGAPAAAAGSPPKARARVEELAPGAAELASQLATQLRAPAAASALIAGASAAVGVFVIGVVVALGFTDQSLIGLVDNGKGVVTGGFAQMLNFVQTGYSGGSGKVGPALFLAFPIGACAVAAALQARRTRALAPPVRLAAGAGTGLVFGLLMLIPALAVGQLDGDRPKIVGAVLLGILWGGIGGLLGTRYAIRRDMDEGALAMLMPARARSVAEMILVAARPLAIALAVMALSGGLVWAVQALRWSGVRSDRSTLSAAVDGAAFAVEHGVHWTELGALVEFRPVAASEVGYPVPANLRGLETNGSGQYRLFGFSGALPAYVFIPLMIWLIGIPLLLALYAGFALARQRGAVAPHLGAAWGALVGPIWAVGMVAVNALVAKYEFGLAQGDSVLGMFLLDGIVIGAIGGFLATRAPSRRTVRRDRPAGS